MNSKQKTLGNATVGQVSAGITVSYSDIQGGWNGPGTGNMNSDPVLDANTYRLTLASPCVDRGAVQGATSSDIDGEVRPAPGSLNPDIGADEWNFTGSLHPQAGDFESGMAGRIIISTVHDDRYYTESPTTINGLAAQSEDGKVRVTVHLPPCLAGQTVYFRAVSPDPDDLSSYEPNTAGGDNRDTPVGPGRLQPASSTASHATINGITVAATETELTITDQYAGDNYQVECSLAPDFSTILDCTAVMTAWQRVYIEKDAMYHVSSDLTTDFIADLDDPNP